MAQLNLRSRRVALAQITIVGIALKLMCGDIREVRTQLQTKLLGDVVSGLHWDGCKALVNLCYHVARKHTFQLLTTFHHGHVVVLHSRIRLHALAFEVEAEHQSPLVIQGIVGIDTEQQVRLQRIAVQGADGGRHADRGSATQVVADACLVGEFVEQFSQILSPCLSRAEA